MNPTTGAKAQDRRESRGQATKLWTGPRTGVKAENRPQSQDQAAELRTGGKVVNRR